MMTQAYKPNSLCYWNFLPNYNNVSRAVFNQSKYTSQPKGVVKPKQNQFLNYFRQSSENRSNYVVISQARNVQAT